MPALLTVEVDAEAARARDLVAEVEVPVLGEDGALALAERRQQHAPRLPAASSGGAPVATSLPAIAKLHRRAAVDVDVARPLRDGVAQDAIELGRTPLRRPRDRRALRGGGCGSRAAARAGASRGPQPEPARAPSPRRGSLAGAVRRLGRRAGRRCLASTSCCARSELRELRPA